MQLPLLILYFVGLYIRPQDWVPGFVGLPIDYFIFGLLLMAFMINIEINKPIFELNIFKMFIAWISVIVISNLIHFEFDMMIDRFVYFFKFLIVFTCLIAFIKSEKQFRIIIVVIILLTAILAYQCIDMIDKGVGWAGQGLGWDGGYGGRAKWVGLWNGMNVLSLLFVTAFPFLIYFVIGPWPIIVRVLSVGCMALIFKGVVLTQSRGGFASLLIVISVSFATKVKIRYVIIGGMLLLPILFGFASGRFTEMDSREGSSYRRVQVWVDGLGMFKSSPLLGVGKGMFKRHASVRLIAHNSFIENFSETGFVGFFIFNMMFYISLLNIYGLSKEAADPRVKSIAAALLCSIIGYAATSLFITTDFDLLYVMFGLTASYCYLHDSFKKIGKRDVYIVAGLSFCFIASVQAFVIYYMR